MYRPSSTLVVNLQNRRLGHHRPRDIEVEIRDFILFTRRKSYCHMEWVPAYKHENPSFLSSPFQVYLDLMSYWMIGFRYYLSNYMMKGKM